MSLNLVKGQRESLSQVKFNIGLGWDTNPSNTPDLDASILLLNAEGKLVSEKHLVYFGQLSSPNGSVVHSGDNLTGAGDGDDEVIKIDLSKIESGVNQIVVVVNIYDAVNRRQNFGQIRNAFIRIIDESGKEVMKYELDEDFSVETGLEFGRLYNRNGDWKFEAIGAGAQADLAFYLKKYS